MIHILLLDKHMTSVMNQQTWYQLFMIKSQIPDCQLVVSPHEIKTKIEMQIIQQKRIEKHLSLFNFALELIMNAQIPIQQRTNGCYSENILSRFRTYCMFQKIITDLQLVVFWENRKVVNRR